MKERLKNLNPKNVASIFMGAAVLSGFVGFIYETIFYLINNGVSTRRGNMFGPWITIYIFGGILLFVCSYKAHEKKHPLLVFVICGLAATLLELVSGYALYHFAGGLRLWDYSDEILNFGNIGGYVCLRSFWSFGLLGLLLMYGVYPFLKWLIKKLGTNKAFILILIFFIILVVDLMYNTFGYKLFGTINASRFYTNTGWYVIVSQ